MFLPFNVFCATVVTGSHSDTTKLPNNGLVCAQTLTEVKHIFCTLRTRLGLVVIPMAGLVAKLNLRLVTVELFSLLCLGVDTKEGLSKLLIKSGVVHLYLPSNDNAVLHELADRLRKATWKKRANQTELVEGDDNLDNLRATMRRKPFKAKFRHPKTMVRELGWFL